MIEKSNDYDVVILGGGLAGLTLALQLHNSIKNVKILVLEKRASQAPTAVHKVGESTSELGSYYLREILQLKTYLTEHQLPKYGFRFFLSPEHNNDISKRVEVGSRMENPFPTHQIDRGLLENELQRVLSEKKIAYFLNAKVENIEFSTDLHEISFLHENLAKTVKTKWIVDATGRSSFLRKKLRLQKDIDHNINAAWFRLNAQLDIDNWSDNLKWRNKVESGRRRLATNHLMGQGYWIWIIPLVSGCTSVGIVADPRYHNFEEFNTFEKAKKWLRTYEPVAAKIIAAQEETIMDFKIMKNMAYQSKQYFSEQRWALTGEAASFMDPFYSPGTDFIALDNSWISELIKRDVNGENILRESLIFNHAKNELIQGWITLYRDQYNVFGQTQIMLMKIVWDWACYWAIPNVLFINGGYTNVSVLKEYSSTKNESIGKRFSDLNNKMQQLFLDWAKTNTSKIANEHINIFELQCLYQLQKDLLNKYNPKELIEKISSNLGILENIAIAIFQLVNHQVNHSAIDMPINPYEARISDLADLRIKNVDNSQAKKGDKAILEDVKKMFFLSKMVLENE